jgi:hypothetical protein
MRWFADGSFLSHAGNLSGYLKALGAAKRKQKCTPTPGRPKVDVTERNMML